MIIKNRHPLPLIIKILDCLYGAKWFLKLDLKDVYYCIYIKYSNKQKIVFYIYYNYFKYLIILFRLANAPAIFQIYINQALARLVDIMYIVYLNNILIFLEDLVEYQQYIK